MTDFKGLDLLRTRLGDDFVHGYVVAFGDRLTAAALWTA